jgi:phosphoribosylformylglycinamidine synthase II
MTAAEPTIIPEMISAHGITPQEYETILQILGRPPRIVELGIFSAMWSEHCSYKNSKPLLRTLPTEGEVVLQGPGENAGVILFEGDVAVAFKMESHNHPSAVEPYEGAATGVGGILRDIFTMGARPVALLDSLRFGDPASARTRHIAQGVVAGIAGYGNAVGVPVVGGETVFDPAYEGNPLVNVMCVGVMKQQDLTIAIAEGPGNLLVYYGNATGRDGIHGAAFASVELTEESTSKRGAVQVGDPFTEKQILEATLDLISARAVVALQDMGAAGLTCSCAEMAGRGGLGASVELDQVPQRASNMSAYEMMLSESQERMLAVVEPARLDEVSGILEHHGLQAHVIGQINISGILEVCHGGRIVAEVPAGQISDNSPVYHREARRPAWLDAFPDARTLDPVSQNEPAALLPQLLSRPNLSSKRWIWNRYDSMVQTQTQVGPGAGVAVLKLDGCVGRLALTSDCRGDWCALNPREGAKLAVAEAAVNLACAGAQPLAITNNLNFGSPLKPEGFYQLQEAVAGIGEACLALNTPVTGGNVSLYNENPQGTIHPTPTIGMVGRIAPDTVPVPVGLPQEPVVLVVLGQCPSHLGGSEFLRMTTGELHGPCPTVDLSAQKRLIELLIAAAKVGILTSANDCGMGGLAVALAEGMLLGSGPTQVTLHLQELSHPHASPTPHPKALSLIQLFAENPGRVLCSAREKDLPGLQRLAEFHQVPLAVMGSARPAAEHEASLHLEGPGLVPQAVTWRELSAAYQTPPWAEATP